MNLGGLLVLLIANIVKTVLVCFGRLDPSPRPLLIYRPAAITRQTIASFKFLILLKVCTEVIQIVKQLQMNRSI